MARSKAPRLSFSLSLLDEDPEAEGGEPDRDVGGRGDVGRADGELVVDEPRDGVLEQEKES